MNVSLTPQLENLIHEKVESGYYNNASEVVREALRLLEERDQNIAWLRTQLAIASEQMERGELIEVNETFWEDLDREVDLQIARGHVPSSDVQP